MPEEAEREKLAEVIRQWNNNRLDLFEISQPDEVSRLPTDFRQVSYAIGIDLGAQIYWSGQITASYCNKQQGN